MKMSQKSGSFLASTAVIAFAAPCGATIVQYSTRAAFNAAAGALENQNFESFAATPNAFRGVWYDFGTFSAFNQVIPVAPNAGSIFASGAVDGSIEIICSVALNGGPFTLSFDRPIFALGFDAVNLADQRYDNLSFNNAAGDVVQVHDSVDQTRFWGFVSDTAFTTLQVRQVAFGPGGGTTDGFRIDNMAFTAVPLPTAVAFGAPGLALIASRRRRLA